jgi:type VI secretion system protein ImpG
VNKLRSYREYFLEELEFLRELRSECLDENPDLAERLGQEDPDVERFLEGAAGLTARTRQALDAELPELLYPLLHQLWPHSLRPTPSLAVVQFDARHAVGLQFGCQVPQHTKVYSREIPRGESDGPVRFTFRTCYAVTILPLVLEETALEGNTLRLRLRLLPRARMQQLVAPQTGAPPRLRLSLHGDVRLVYGLYWGLCRQRGITVRVPQLDLTLSSQKYPALKLHQLGFVPNEALLPYPAHSFQGHRHLHEYFIFPEKHLFFDLEGLEQVEQLILRRHAENQAERLEVNIELDPPPIQQLVLGRDAIRLNCVPAVNLFPHPAATQRINHSQPDYEVIPSGDASAYDIFSIEKVVRDRLISGQSREERLRCFDNAERSSSSSGLLYQVRPRSPVRSVAEEYQPARVYLAFVDPSGDPATLTDETIISADLLCTNRDLPFEHLQAEGDISGISTAIPEGIRLRSVGKISEAMPAPVGVDGRWRFFALMGLGWNVIASVDSLRELLHLYCPQAHASGKMRQRLERLGRALDKIELFTKPLLLGQPPTLIQGSQIILHMKDSAVEYPGQLLLFGQVLGRFIADLSTINTYTQLHIETRGLERLTFPALLGCQGALGV